MCLSSKNKHLTRLDFLPPKYIDQVLANEKPSKPRKYRNQPTEYLGFLYDSRKEAQFAQALMLRMKAGDIKDWSQQVRINFEVTTDGTLVAKSKNVYLPQVSSNLRFAGRICSHDMDFLIVHPDGSIELAEIKSEGTKTRVWEIKRHLLELSLLREHPEIKYRVYD